QRSGSEGLGEGDVVRAGGLEVQVVATPGHTSDSLSFVLPADGAVLTGDTVLGRGTTVVAHPDGRLDDYLESLQRLGSLAADGADVQVREHRAVPAVAHQLLERALDGVAQTGLLLGHGDAVEPRLVLRGRGQLVVRLGAGVARQVRGGREVVEHRGRTAGAQ